MAEQREWAFSREESPDSLSNNLNIYEQQKIEPKACIAIIIKKWEAMKNISIWVNWISSNLWKEKS